MAVCLSDQVDLSYGALPMAVIKDRRLDDGSRVLYSVLYAYSQGGKSWASNGHLAKVCGTTDRTIRRRLLNLIEAGYIRVEMGLRREIFLTPDYKNLLTSRDEIKKLSRVDTGVRPPGHECPPPDKIDQDLGHKCPPPPDTNVHQINSSVINIKDNNNNKDKEGAAAPAMVADAPVVVSFENEIFDCLKDLSIPEPVKLRLSKAYSEDVVKHAVAYHKAVPLIKTSLAQKLQWACREKPALPASTVDVIQSNKDFASQICQKYCAPQSGIRKYPYIDVGSKYIEIANGPGMPRVIQFSESGFQGKVEESLRRARIL